MADSNPLEKPELDLFYSSNRSLVSLVRGVVVRGVFLLGSLLSAGLLLLLPGVFMVEFGRAVSWTLLRELSPVIGTTFLTAVLGLGFALPLSGAIALGLVLSPKSTLSKLLRTLLATVSTLPTVVIGYGAFTIITPLLQTLFPARQIESFNTLSVAIGIAILITPMVTQGFLKALTRLDPVALAAATAIGSTWTRTVLTLVVPTSIRGFVGVGFLAFSRALGQTMISALAGGIGTFTRLGAGSETLGSFIVRLGSGVVDGQSSEYQLLFGAGFLLFCITLGFYLLGLTIDSQVPEGLE